MSRSSFKRGRLMPYLTTGIFHLDQFLPDPSLSGPPGYSFILSRSPYYYTVLSIERSLYGI